MWYGYAFKFAWTMVDMETYLTAFVIESFLLLTTMQTSSPFLLWSPESFLHWLVKLWLLSVRSMALSTVIPSAPRPVLLLPPRDKILRPMLAKLDPLDSESVRLNLLKWSWKTGTETVGRRSCWPPGTGTELRLEQELSLLSVRLRCFANSPNPMPGTSSWFLPWWFLKETALDFLESFRNIRCGYLQGDLGASISNA